MDGNHRDVHGVDQMQYLSNGMSQKCTVQLFMVDIHLVKCPIKEVAFLHTSICIECLYCGIVVTSVLFR